MTDDTLEWMDERKKHKHKNEIKHTEVNKEMERKCHAKEEE